MCISRKLGACSIRLTVHTHTETSQCSLHRIVNCLKCISGQIKYIANLFYAQKNTHRIQLASVWVSFSAVQHTIAQIDIDIETWQWYFTSSGRCEVFRRNNDCFMFLYFLRKEYNTLSLVLFDANWLAFDFRYIATAIATNTASLVPYEWISRVLLQAIFVWPFSARSFSCSRISLVQLVLQQRQCLALHT